MRENDRKRICAFNSFLASIGHKVVFLRWNDKIICSGCDLIFKIKKTSNWKAHPSYTVTIRNSDNVHVFNSLKLLNYSLDVIGYDGTDITKELIVLMSCEDSNLNKLKAFI